MRSQDGFTLLELLTVVIIIGILAALSIPQYTRSLESAKADDAAAVVKMIGTTNRMFQLDNDQYVTGLITGSCTGNCPSPIPTSPDVCTLVQCRYLSQQDFASKGYTFRAIAGGAQSCGLTTRSTAKTTTNRYVACAKRCSGAPPCTTTLKFQVWGYAMDDAGALHAFGAAGNMPPEH